MARLLTVIGVLVTILYSVFIYCLISPQLDKLRTLPLNELGDFLAGVFGPLAIFWLILGFLQQGKELQQSTEALELQAKELKNSVEQQKGLVNATKEQITEIRRASIRPNLEIYLQSNIASMQFMDLHLENTGSGTAKNGSSRFRGVTTTYSVKHIRINVGLRHQAKYAEINALYHKCHSNVF
ncbi:hypothetical protein [Methyloprofundus sedimenti]|uniref:hypothetical protein n=1 Tax=Methyloprofundus sedimenti TaxID=1420851 RepID=UPI00117DCC4D|nr:hypothetical protein [Methyloprofundus sedimenti]